MIDAYFHLINDSPMDIVGLKIQLKTFNLEPIACTIIRERGSLTLQSPLEEIYLGNFCSYECCDITLVFSEDALVPSPEQLLDCFILDDIPDVSMSTLQLKDILTLNKF